MTKKTLFLTFTIAAAIMLPSCSSEPAPAPKVETEAKKEPAKPPEPVGARTPYFEAYRMARQWAPDALGLTVTAADAGDFKVADGKAGKWTVVFVSPTRKEARTFDYVVTDIGDLRKGVNVSGPQLWGGATPTAKAFSNTEFLIDSDVAYKAAAEKAADWLKTHPNQKLTMALGNSSRFAAPVWYVMWGTKASGYFAFVNAVTGQVVTQ